jgi:hypothetical protein
MADDSSAAWPQADQQLSQEILDLVSFITISQAKTMQSGILVIGHEFSIQGYMALWVYVNSSL